MSLTWAQFKAEVRLYLHLYNEVTNVQTLIDTLIPRGAEDVQRSIDYFKTGHVDVLDANTMTQEGFAFTTTAPNGKITAIRLVKYDTDANELRPNVFRSLKQLDWSKFPAMRGGEVALCDGFVAIDRVTRKLAVTPGLNSETRLLIEWNGIKSDFADGDVTPFDKEMAEAVGYFTLARISRVTDKDMAQHQSYEGEYVRLKRKIASEKNWNHVIDDRTESQLNGDETTSGGLFPPTPINPLFVFRPDITSLTGGTATALDGQATENILGDNTVYFLIIGAVQQYWRLVPGTQTTSVPDGFVRPLDYAASTNERVWQRLT